MPGWRRLCFFVCLVGIVTFLLTMTISRQNAGAQQKPQTLKWEWTKQNPKPDWWRWGTTKDKPVRGGVYQSAAAQYVGLMNPNHWPVLDWGAITQMYDGMAYIDASQNPRGLWLIKSYKYVDPETCVMELRPGIQFHDGSPFNAEAVKYTIDYIMDKKNGAWTRLWIEPVKSIEVVDELTVKWNFKRPWAGFMGMMSTTPGYIISKKALEGDVALKALKKVANELKNEQAGAADLEKTIQTLSGEKAEATAKQLAESKKKVAELENLVAQLTVKSEGAKDVDQNPVGAGAFMLEEGRPGNYLKLKRNPNWWFGKAMGLDMPFFDGMVITIIPDESIRLANLRAGKIDYLSLTPTQYQDIKDDPRFITTSTVSNFMSGLKFNQAKGPCQDIRVRKAVSYAINREAIVKGMFHGLGVVASGPYHSTHWAHNPNLKPVAYNPELSKKLLKEAGYVKGLTLKGHAGTTTTNLSNAEAIKSMLAKVGIAWEVVSLDPVAISDRDKNLEFDLAQGGWSYIKEPDMLATGMYHPDGGFNFGRTNNPKVLALIDKGRTELDMEKRKKIYWELEKVVYDNYEDVWIYYPLSITIRTKRLLGFDPKGNKEGGEYYSFSHRSWFKNGRRE